MTIYNILSTNNNHEDKLWLDIYSDKMFSKMFQLKEDLNVIQLCEYENISQDSDVSSENSKNNDISFIKDSQMILLNIYDVIKKKS